MYLRHKVFQFPDKLFCNRCKDLIFSPDQIHICLKGRGERTEDKSALPARICQVFKSQEISEPFADKDGPVVGETERGLQIKLIQPVSAPSGQIGQPSLSGTEQRETQQVFKSHGLFLRQVAGSGHYKPPQV